MSIPSSCLLSAEFARESPELLALHDEVPEEFWAARLALVLLAERSKGDAGALAPYVRTLPASFTVPLLWSPEAVKLLQYQPVQSALLKSAKLVGSFASEQLAQAPSAFGVRAVDANAFGWAVAACSSRAFRVGGGARALCPIIDLGNHAPREEATCEVRGTLGGKVELVAKRGIELGEEVTYCYGELSNDAFLLDYGFVPTSPPNRYDHVQLAWASGGLLQTACATAGMASELTPWQTSAIRATIPTGLEYVRVTRSGVDEVAMAACRIAAATDAGVLRKAAGGAKPLPSGGEVRALKIAAAMCAIALTSLPEGGTPAAEAAETGVEGAESVEGAAVGAAGFDGGEALARCFLDEKRSLCSHAVGHVGSRIKAVQQGEARAELRGISKPKKASGVRKPSARKGKQRPQASGFGK